MPQTPSVGGGVGPEFSLPSLHNGLQAFYNLSDLTDSSGNNRTLTNVGGVTFGPGKIGDAAVFNGAQGKDLHPSEDLGKLESSGYSFSVWISKNSSDEQIVVGYSDSVFTGWLLTTGHFFYGSGSSWGEEIDREDPLAANDWAHFVFSVNGAGDMTIYRNNTIVIQRSGITWSAGQTLRLGRYFPQVSEDGSTNSKLDAVGVWSRALSASEVAALYNDGVRAIANGGTGASTAAGARAALGLGTAATTNASAYATAAQGTKADNSATKTDSIVNALIFG